MSELEVLQKRIVNCNQCARLRTHCKKVAREKRAAFLKDTYWGKPVPSWGDPTARLVIVGLAPAAHGANRTGRMFTGDRSGDWLYRALHRAGFASQAKAESSQDGLQLYDTWITATAHCAPPDNKPTPTEIARCTKFLTEELKLFPQAKVYLALGGIALASLWPRLKHMYSLDCPRPAFGHGKEVSLAEGKTLLLSYHPSQQNTFTGRLTEPMFDAVFSRAKKLIQT